MSSTPPNYPPSPQEPPAGQYGAPPAAPQPPKRPWFKKKRFIIPLALLVLIVLVQAVGGKGSTEESSPAGGTSKASASETKAAGKSEAAGKSDAAVVGLGSPARDGKFEFTANKVTCGLQEVGGQYLKETAQGQFCVLDLTVKNIGEKPQLFSASSQKAFSGSTEYSSSSQAAIAYASGKGLDTGNWFKDINPGNKMTTVVVFDIPTDKKLDKLQLHDSPFSGGVSVTP